MSSKSLFTKSFGSALAAAAIVLLSACAPNLGGTIDAPSIPSVSPKGDARARLGSYLSIQTVEDARTKGISGEAGYTEPAGKVTQIVEDGIKNAFRENGISILDSAPVSLRTEIRQWRAKVTSAAQAEIDSEATIFVEALDPAGKVIYSGTYTGNRSSKFPIVSRIDVQDSLGLAMANAIGQAVADPAFLNVLSAY